MATTDDEVNFEVLQDKWIMIHNNKKVYILRQDAEGLITAKIKTEPDSVELVGVKKLAKATGSRYGGPARMCELSFTLGDDIEHKAYFACISEKAHQAGDVHTAFLMPLPGSAFYPIEC